MELNIDFLISRSIMLGGLLSRCFIHLHSAVLTVREGQGCRNREIIFECVDLIQLIQNGLIWEIWRQIP